MWDNKFRYRHNRWTYENADKMTLSRESFTYGRSREIGLELSLDLFLLSGCPLFGAVFLVPKGDFSQLASRDQQRQKHLLWAYRRVFRRWFSSSKFILALASQPGDQSHDSSDDERQLSDRNNQLETDCRCSSLHILMYLSITSTMSHSHDYFAAPLIYLPKLL